uniref:Uncharacterized protein n=1 Tax=Avena sativa TaxID=4498 RepID=A0ACD5V369_AVESA
MAKSSSATASGSKKRKSKSGALTHEKVKSLGQELLSSRAHLNHAPALLALLTPSTPLSIALEALISLQSFFEPLLPSIPSASAAAAAAEGESGDPDLVFGAWLRQRFDEFVAALIELSVSSQSDEAIREVALDAFMGFVKLGKDGRFHSAIYHKFLHAVLHATDSIDPLLELLGSKYSKYADVWYVVVICATPKYSKYADVCYFTYTSLDKITNSLGSQITGSGKDGLQNGDDSSEDRKVIVCYPESWTNILLSYTWWSLNEQTTIYCCLVATATAVDQTSGSPQRIMKRSGETMRLVSLACSFKLQLEATSVTGSSLWEIDTLRHHYTPAVSRFVASLENDLTVRAKTTEMKITDFSSDSYATVFRDEVRRRIKQVPLAFYSTTPTSLFQGSDFPGWTHDYQPNNTAQASLEENENHTVETSDASRAKRSRV